MIEIPAYLRKQRREHGLTLDGIAEKTGFHMSYISKLENGVLPITPSVIRAYARALKWHQRDTDWLLLQVGEIAPDLLKYFINHRAEYERVVQSCKPTQNGW